VRIVGYVRVSTRKQAEGESLDAQEEAIRSWADEQGHEVAAVFVDNGRSGTLDAIDRPGLLEALALLEDGDAEALVVHRLDRLARALHVQEAVLARVWSAGAEVWEVVGSRQVLEDDPDDPMRTFVRQVTGAGAQLERGMVVARMQGGRRRKVSRNGYVGGKVPYGWEREGHGTKAVLVKLPDEQRVLRRMRGLRKRDKSYRAIADRLNADGVTAKNGGRWFHTAVRTALLRTA
jgi:DNA invertase Pin-like site-specific DNA recombinase